MEIEQDEPVYHERWEGSVIAGILATIMAGLYNVDQFRAGIDNLEPLSYLTIGYYRRWLHTLEVNCTNAGVFTPEELEARLAQLAERPDAPGPVRDDPRIDKAMRELLQNGASNARAVSREPRFRGGDRVRGRTFPAARHVRIPAYAQGKAGTVRVVHQAFVFPDTNLRDEGENPEHVYAVAFTARDLWPDADEHTTVLVDLWESYLEPVVTTRGGDGL